MNQYTYSEARQNLAAVLEAANQYGKVIIRRRDGSIFSLKPEKKLKSPLDVPSIKAKLKPGEWQEWIKKSRRRDFKAS